MANIINFNGKTYTSLADMPADERRLYEQLMGAFGDQNQDGVPDMFEGLVGASAGGQPVVHAQTTIVYNGQVYHSLDQMPPAVRADYAQVQAQFDANANGLPDAVEGLINQFSPAAADPAAGRAAPVAAPSPYNAPVVSPEGSSWRFRLALLAIVGLGAMVCVLAVIAAWALLR